MIDTSVKAVTIYSDGAIIQRGGEVALKEGLNTVKIGGVPSKTDINKIRFFFPKGITGNNIWLINPSDLDEDDHSASDEVYEKLQTVKQQIDILKKQSVLWLNNGEFQKSDGINIQDMETYIERLPFRIGTINSKIRELEKKEKKLEEELKDLRKKENEPYLSIDLNAPEEKTYPFYVQYYESSAQWYPVYQIYTDGKGESVNIKITARIIQQTEEDWDQIKVTLVSGDPTESKDIPELRSVYLDYVPEKKGDTQADNEKNRSVKLLKSTNLYFDDDDDYLFDDDTDTGMFELDAGKAEMHNDGSMTEYVLDSYKTILHGIRGTAADLQQFTLEADYRLTIIPKKEKAAFLTAAVKKRDLPSSIRGTASVYVNGMYAGTTNINPDMTKDTVLLSLGKDEKIHVKRKEVGDVTFTDMFETHMINEKMYEIIVSSSSDESVVVHIVDQIPVSRNKGIVVETIDLGNGELDQATGKVEWVLELQPKQTITLPLAYRITWPQDKEIKEKQ